MQKYKTENFELHRVIELITKMITDHNFIWKHNSTQDFIMHVDGIFFWGNGIVVLIIIARVNSSYSRPDSGFDRHLF